MNEDYNVNATFVYGRLGDEEWGDDIVGSVSLKEDALAKDMPHELEINGFTYKREDLI